ncbi:hypothetical protein CKO13_02575 [Halorhodospira neutriphila]|uniref:Glycoside hydrolase family 5 domain-containing protein n=1 Tax=Halorhodospira neutriphila TaxID=168379 RepID=A0ABS1E578_9GAMM|nr:hypothetical protein [Halorhodospira neutriphila]
MIPSAPRAARRPRRCRTAAALVIGLLVVLLHQGAAAGCLGEEPLRGVNLAGAEFNSEALPGRLGQDYVYPGNAMIADFAERGVTAIRLPVRWERLQRELGGPLHGADSGQLRRILAEAREQDLCVLVDIHNYGAYRGERLGTRAVPTAAFIDLWERLAGLASPEHLALGLMNEPIKLSVSRWSQVAQETVSALRERGVRHLILVSGGRWSGVHDWQEADSGGVSNAEAFADFSDPLGRGVIEVHQYPDTNYSGTRQECHPPAHFTPMFEAITDWARAHGQRLFLGEFGARDQGACLDSLGRIVGQASGAPVWRGWAYWASGPWWGDYPLALDMDAERRPRWERIEPHLPSGGSGDG